MDNLKSHHNQNLINAWTKICDWCKENLASIHPGGVSVRLPFEPYGWKILAVTQDGEVQFHSGSHGDSSTTAVTRDHIHRFDSAYVEGKRVWHSHFYDNENPIGHSVPAILGGVKEPITDHCNLCLIEKAIGSWGYLKARLLEIKHESETLTYFEP